VTSEDFTDEDWRTLLSLILRHVRTDRFQQWDMFSLPLSGTSNRLYVQWGMKPPEGDEYQHHYPLVDPETGKVAPE
jgi:hypothetical protein